MTNVFFYHPGFKFPGENEISKKSKLHNMGLMSSSIHPFFESSYPHFIPCASFFSAVVVYEA